MSVYEIIEGGGGNNSNYYGAELGEERWIRWYGDLRVNKLREHNKKGTKLDHKGNQNLKGVHLPQEELEVFTIRFWRPLSSLDTMKHEVFFR